MELSALPRLFADFTVLVLGDIMLDRFIYGRADRLSPEGPIPVLVFERELSMPGGAANVARNIAALGGKAVLIGVVGQDSAGEELRQLVTKDGRILAEFLTLGQRCTTHKIRYVARQQQLLRVDNEHVITAPALPLFKVVLKYLSRCNAVVLSDYAKGVLSPELLRDVIAEARRAGKPVIVDPKSRDLSRYAGATILTPNHNEVALATGIICEDDASVELACERVLGDMTQTEAVLITRGPKGMTLGRLGKPVRHIRAAGHAVFDVSGAGDTVVAALALSVAAQADLDNAATVANVAGGISVSKPGTATVEASELSAALRAERFSVRDGKAVSLEAALHKIKIWRAGEERIGFTNGCFDLLHPGHISLLSQARSACDRLVVALNSDSSVKVLKGANRPIQDELSRALVLASLSAVDLVVLFDEVTPIKLIEAIRPDVLVKGSDYSIDQVVGADVVQSYGGKVILAELMSGHSTTKTVSRINDVNS